MTQREFLLRNENLLILVAEPGEEVSRCGRLIARASALARTPLLVVLTDGGGDDAMAEARAQATRANAARLGVPAHRVFLFGLLAGQAAPFRRIVEALIFLMWSRDCGVIAAPGPGWGGGAHDVALAAAEHVAAETRVGLLVYGAEGA